jgi:hypothetical protein
MVADITEYRLARQLQSASTASSRDRPPKAGPAARDAWLVLLWRKVSPSGWLMVDPRSGARAVIRDTGSDTGRYLWSVLPSGDVRPLSEGRTQDLEYAKSMAEAALRANAENRVRCGYTDAADVVLR